MTTELWDEDGELPSGTRFWGGEKRGVCIQLTKKERDSSEHPVPYGYITVSKAGVPRLIKYLTKFAQGDYRHRA